MLNWIRVSGFTCAWLCLMALPGCVQIDQTVQLNEDKSGKIIEVVRFEDRLVQASKSSPEFATLLDFLKEDRARERLPMYGEVTLESHEVKDLGAKGCEAR